MMISTSAGTTIHLHDPKLLQLGESVLLHKNQKQELEKEKNKEQDKMGEEQANTRMSRRRTASIPKRGLLTSLPIAASDGMLSKETRLQRQALG
jgi:hypothetical protein